MDWIHCNVCFYLPCQLPKRDFKLTSCGHIFCQCCEQSGIIEKCKICSVKCTTTPLSSQMAPEIQEYFEDLESAYGKLLKVMEFQKIHRQRLNENYRKVVEKYQKLKVHCLTIEEENKKMKNELTIYKRQQTMQAMTPPQPKEVQYPLFSRNSQASQAIRKGLSQSSVGSASSSFFMTPKMSQQYRVQSVTPSPTLSNASSQSPASVSSLNQMSQQRGPVSSQQRPYKPGLTPPINSLRMLSFGSQKNRNPTRY